MRQRHIHTIRNPHRTEGPGTHRGALLLLAIALSVAACEHSSPVLPDAAALRLLEVEVNGDVAATDEVGKPTRQPWVEIHNPNDFAVSLDPYSLTDSTDRPNAFRFPLGRTLEPGAYLVVFLFDPAQCRKDCLVACGERCAKDADDAYDACRVDCFADGGDVEGCIAGCREQLAAAQAECATQGEAQCVSFQPCMENCVLTGLTAGFGVGHHAATVYLFGNGRVVDRIAAHEQAAGTSHGIDPVTGELGVMYFATPGGPNRPANLRPHLFRDLPSPPPVSECDRDLAVECTIERDVEPSRAPLRVRLEYAEATRADPVPWPPPLGMEQSVAEREACTMLVTALESSDPGFAERNHIELSAVPAELVSTSTEVDSHRRDPSGAPAGIVIDVLRYRAYLPAAECGALRAFRVVAVDDASPDGPRTLSSFGQCLVTGEAPPAVLVREYQPRNSKIPFEQFGRFDRLGWEDGTPPGDAVGKVVTPDWIEVLNAGDETADIGNLGFVTAGDIAAGTFDEWIFGFEGLGEPKPIWYPEAAAPSYPLAPGDSALFLANADGGRNRHWYYLTADPERDRPYYSTHFRLEPDRGRTEPFDEFSLVDTRTRRILDRVVLDFSANQPPYDVLPDRAVGRFEAEGTIPGALRPGTITDCPTPGGPNELSCEVSPRFEEELTRSSASGSACPLPLEQVALRARVHFDRDTVQPEDRQVNVLVSVDGGPFDAIAPGDVTVVVSADQDSPAPASTSYDVGATLPGSADGTFVVYRFVARDLRLARAGLPEGDPVEFGDETAPAVSFRYLVGYSAPAGHPRIHEVLPGNRSLEFSPFDCLARGRRPHPDFVEIYNPSPEPLDLGGYYLADAPDLETPLGRARRWRFPDGTTVAAGGVVAAWFEPPPECLSEEERAIYLHVDGLGLDACGEALYLIAPDDPGRGANCVVDRLAWTRPTATPCFPNDTALAYLCETCEEIVETDKPTPGVPNRLPPIVHDATHQDVLAFGAVGGCVSPTAGLVNLKAICFVDAKIVHDPSPRGALGRGVGSAKLVIDLGGGEVEIPATKSSQVVGVPDCIAGLGTESCATPPGGYAGVGVSWTLPAPAGSGFPSAVRFRVVVTDALGDSTASPAWSFGTTEGDHPAVVINELNRGALVPGDPVPRAWIELLNLSGSTVDLSGSYLSDHIHNPRKARIPDGVVIGPSSHLVVVTDGSTAAGYPSVTLDWAADPGGAPLVHLFDAPGRGSCSLDVVHHDIGGLPAGVSLGRLPDGSGGLTALPAPTPGTGNQPQTTFVRADANEDLKVNVTDMAWSLRILFAGETDLPECLDALDANDDGTHSTSDPVYIGNALFRGGPTIPPPFSRPGLDPTGDGVAACSLVP